VGGQEMTDLNFNIDFRNGVLNAIENANRVNGRSTIEGTKDAALPIMLRFAEQEIKASIERNDPPIVTLRALGELERMMTFLVDAGCLEFQSQIDSIRRGRDKIARTALKMLVERFLSQATPPEQVALISEGLVKIIEAGAWPNWQNEFNAAVDATVEARREAGCRSSI
jgi:hypothetical protein